MMAREYDEPMEAVPDRPPIHERVTNMDKELTELQETVRVLRHTVDRLAKTISRELDV